MRDRATVPLPAVTPSPPRARAQSFPGRPEDVRQARTFIAAVLNGHHAAADAILLASELGANAVAHSASGRPGGTLTVRARIDGKGQIHVEVEDQGSPWDGDISAAQAPHGLYLLHALSAACGTRRSEQGWVTWFTLTAPATRQAEP